ncbi:MAG: adenylosuccinate synthetase [Verrucomicrobiae bacterium]|nr:adenylosuccinate synthetase [Verrucomicrobiae bacterium]
MPKLIVLLSGRVCAGKTTLARRLGQTFADKYKLKHVKTFDFLKRLGDGIELQRDTMQEFGERLDRRSGGAWVCEELLREVQNHDEDAIVVLDSVRILGQIEAIRKAFGKRVIHIHLDARLTELEKRYKRRNNAEIKELASYADVQRNKTERNVPKLAKIADVVILTDRCTEDDVLIRAASHVGLFGREYLRLVDVVVGGQFGSEGKGQIASFLSREYELLVRVGGPNAGHTVYQEPDPYTFHHLPSGTNSSQAKLLIVAGAVLYVPTLMKEIAECQVDRERLIIDPQAMIITDADRRRETNLVANIGSTGQGVGQATARRVLRGKTVKLAKDIPELKPYIGEGLAVLEHAFAHRHRVLLEGTQGTGLSLYHGYYPHVTSRDTTVAGCLAEAGISPNRVQRVVMVCRTYPIRVQSPKGATSGEMSQEISWEEVAQRSRHDAVDLRSKELTSTTKRQRRVSEFDWALLRRAATLNAPTDIALTFVDYIAKANEKARRFEQLTPDTIRFIEEVERVAAAPVSLVSTRFHSRSIIDRRMW